jgi:hypothetical protein
MTRRTAPPFRGFPSRFQKACLRQANEQRIDRPGFEASLGGERPTVAPTPCIGGQSRQDQDGAWRNANRVCHLANSTYVDIPVNPRPRQGMALRAFAGPAFCQEALARPSWQHSVPAIGHRSAVAFARNLSRAHCPRAHALGFFGTIGREMVVVGTDCLHM